MDLANLNGLMVENMKEIIKMTKKKDMEYSLGLMVEYIKEIGKMEGKKVRENFTTQKMIDGKMEYGKKEKE
jgi:hypothetical protein